MPGPQQDSGVLAGLHRAWYCRYARHWTRLAEPIRMGGRRIYALCGGLARSPSGHGLLERGLWLSSGTAAPRLRQVGLSRLRRVDRRTYRQRSRERSRPAGQQHHHAVAGAPPYWRSSRTSPSPVACRRRSSAMRRRRSTAANTFASPSTSAISNIPQTTMLFMVRPLPVPLTGAVSAGTDS